MDNNFKDFLRNALTNADAKNTALYNKHLGNTAQPASDSPSSQTAESAPNISSGMSLDAFRNMVLQDVDFRPRGVSPKDVRDNLETFRKDFSTLANSAETPEDLYKKLAEFIDADIQTLFFQTNDYMSVRIHKDYVKDFIDQLCIQMSGGRTLDKDTLNRFEDLEGMYDMGTLSYGEMNRSMDYATEGSTNSLLVKANTTREEMIASGDTNPPELTHVAHETFWELLHTNYGIDPFMDPPSPYLMLLCKESDILARSQLRILHPQLNFQDPELCTDERYTNQFLAILDTWKDRLAKNPTIDNAYNIRLDLQKRIRASDHLPENFDDLVEKAHQTAAKAVESKIMEVLRDHNAMTQTPVPLTRGFIQTLHPSYNTGPYLENSLHWYLNKMDQHLTSDNKEELVEQLEQGLDMLADKITLYGLHPATALLAEDYIKTFRETLGESLQAAQCTDIPFLGRLKELEQKASLTHENQRVLGDWCMEETTGGHDNYFHQVLLTIGSKQFPMQAEDLQRIAEHVGAAIASATEDRGIPASLSSVQYMPLLYARRRDVAETEILHATLRSVTQSIYTDEARKGKRDRKNSTLAKILADNPAHATWVSQIGGGAISVSEEDLTPEEKSLRNKVIQTRTLDLLQETITQLIPPEFREENAGHKDDHTSDSPQAGDDAEAYWEPNYPIELTAHNLRLAFAYLDQVEHQQRPQRLH